MVSTSTESQLSAQHSHQLYLLHAASYKVLTESQKNVEDFNLLYDIIPPEFRAKPKQDSGTGTKKTARPKLPC